MKYLFSRYGGSAITIGKGKASDKNLPENQSIEYMLENKAIQMNGYSYLSSYRLLPEFMGAYANLPKNGVKLAEIDHDFNEVILQYEVSVSSIVYIVNTDYSNVFAVFIKSDPRDLESIFGKMNPSYDCVLVFRILDKSESEIKNKMSDILNTILITLIFEMDAQDGACNFRPSKTHLGKKINLEKLEELFETIKEVDSEEQRKKLLSL